MTSNSDWFKKTATVVRTIVDQHGGAVVMTRPELVEAVLQADDTLSECPETILRHLTCALRCESLTSCGYHPTDANVLLVFDAEMSEQTARRICEDNGLSPAVELYMAHGELMLA